MENVSVLTILRLLCFLSFLSPLSLWAGIDITVDPHGKEGKCDYCHSSKVVEKGKADFRLGTIEATCVECHKKQGETLKEYLCKRLPDVKIKAEMIVYFAGHSNFSCHSCHDPMCQGKSREQLKRRNPHVQLDNDGRVIERACLFCHTIVPDYRNPKREDVVLRYDIRKVCSLCHAMQAQKRGLGHGQRMPRRMIRKKERFEKQHDVSLPLGPDNTVICASCHNPHQARVILGKGGATITPGEHRLRVDDVWQLCVACHWGGE